MTVADLTQPDPIRLVREYLTETAEVTALVSSRVYSRTSDPLPTLPLIRLDLAGGSMPVKQRLAAWRIQVHVFGEAETEPATLAAANTVLAALVAARNFVGDTGVITGVDVESLPILLHDDTRTPALVDVTFSVAVYIHN